MMVGIHQQVLVITILKRGNVCSSKSRTRFNKNNLSNLGMVVNQGDIKIDDKPG